MPHVYTEKNIQTKKTNKKRTKNEQKRIKNEQKNELKQL